MRAIHVGLSDSDRKASVALLNVSLASESLLMIKIKKCHWDVFGPQFGVLRNLWQRQHDRVSISAHEVAERIRQLGGQPLATATSFVECACIREHSHDAMSVGDALDGMLADHETIACVVREHTARCHHVLGDLVTAELLTRILKSHEEMAWELRSLADERAELWQSPLQEAKAATAVTTGVEMERVSATIPEGGGANGREPVSQKIAGDTHWAD